MLLAKNVCRCCLGMGCYKDISTEYFWAGQKEVYADMLLETFNVTISYKEGCGPSSGSRLICDGCITRLRNAVAFKQQVLLSEKNIETLLKQLDAKDCLVNPTQQIKVDQSEYDSYEDDFPEDTIGENSKVNDEQQNEFNFSDLDLKDEIDEEAIDCYDNQEGELFVIRMMPENTKNENDLDKSSKALSERNYVRRKGNGQRRKKSSKDKSINEKSQVPERRRPLKTPPNELKMKENTIKLVVNSNICLFKSLRIKYQCFYCKDSFFDIKELKEHEKMHKSDREKYISISRGRSFKNAEITNLTCKLCSESCVDIEFLQDHLTKSHNIAFETEKHMLIPYKIEEELKCVQCNSKFKTFVRLLIHMNTHYTNHVCETCGVSFINKLSLRIHVSGLHKERKCRICQAMFPTNSALMRHVIKIHDPTKRSKRYCLLCNKTFKYTYLLHEHRIEEHGVVRETAKCEDCNKTFISPQNLKLHIRSVHMKERNYQCTYCTMRFFTSTDQKRHERTHGVNDSELFMCSYCDTKFKSKDSWRRHSNKQHARLY